MSDDNDYVDTSEIRSKKDIIKSYKAAKSRYNRKKTGDKPDFEYSTWIESEISNEKSARRNLGSRKRNYPKSGSGGIASFVLMFIGAIYFAFSGGYGNASGNTSDEESNGLYAFTENRLFTQKDCKKFSKEELKIVRNEIYARYGYVFKDQDLNNYFNQKKWYKATKNETTLNLSQIESENVRLIIECEKTK